MTYHIYTTEGIVLRKINVDEANSIFYVLTKDLGLIFAKAQGVRLQNSKLKSSLQEFSLVTVSCVKGKSGWKVTNAICQKNFFFENENHHKKFIANVANVLIRMMPGEEKSSEVFNEVLNFFNAMKNIDKSNIENLEVLCMLRVLYHLGYIEINNQTEKYIYNKEPELLISDVLSERVMLVSHINKGLKESHL